MKHELNADGLNNLRYAIAKQACLDYAKALKRLKKWENDPNALKMAHECERFFRSQWYSYLCDVDGDKMIQVLRERVEDGKISFTEDGGKQ